MIPRDAEYFDKLRCWSDISDRELALLDASELEDTLKYLQFRLLSEKEIEFLSSMDSIKDQIGFLSLKVKSGSNELGLAIIKYHEYIESGFHSRAIDTFNNFISTCTSDCYKEVARSYLANSANESRT